MLLFKIIQKYREWKLLNELEKINKKCAELSKKTAEANLKFNELSCEFEKIRNR